MNNKLLLLITLFICSFTYAQNSFRGVVIEEDTSMNVTNAIVAIEGTAIAQQTDANGAFNFSNKLPDGDHVVTITKEGYITKYLLIEVASGQNIIMDNIKVEVNKQERKRREKAIKAQQKEAKKSQKEKDEFLSKSRKEKEKKEKELEKQRKKLLKEKKKSKNIEEFPVYEDNEPISSIENSTNEVTSLQIKYGSRLNVTPETISSTKLYEFIEDWEGTKYVLGGETREGIDCSSFTQRLYTTVYDRYLERTAQKQFDSKLTDKFLGKEFLREGDLIFFRGSGENKNDIVHVGIYLHNGYFVHATSYSKDNGVSGVKTSNLTDPFWSRRFVAGGRRQKN